MRLGVRAAVIGREVVPGDVEIDQGRVAGIGAVPAGGLGTAVPGFVDLQVNGFAGIDFLEAGPEGHEAAARALGATGVTAYQPTFISSPVEVYRDALETVATLPARTPRPRLLGVHLEGPFLSRARAGAHNPDNIRPVDLELAGSLCAAGPVTYMTVAPELPGALELIRELRRRGVTVACGHSDADAAAAHRGFDAGATAVTHIFNGQRRFQPRDPGLPGVALARSDVVVQAIVDHVHLAPETACLTFAASRGRFALVTDAIAAAGLGDGSYRLGDRKVRVEDGVARLSDGTLAGSVLTMDQAVRNLVELGTSLPEASQAASAVPADLIGRPELGTLRPGTPADIAVLGESLAVVRTLVGGKEVFAL